MKLAIKRFIWDRTTRRVKNSSKRTRWVKTRRTCYWTGPRLFRKKHVSCRTVCQITTLKLTRHLFLLFKSSNWRRPSNVRHPSPNTKISRTNFCLVISAILWSIFQLGQQLLSPSRDENSTKQVTWRGQFNTARVKVWSQHAAIKLRSEI